MKETVKNQIADALIRAKENGDLNFQEMPDIVIEEPKDEKLGDFATTLAMQLARSEKKNPKVIAETICGFLNDGADSIETFCPPRFKLTNCTSRTLKTSSS